MKVLMVMQHVNFFRNLDTVVRELHARGDEVVLLHGTRMDDPKVMAKLERKKKKMAHMGRGIEKVQSDISNVKVGYRPEPTEPWYETLLVGREFINRSIYFRKGHPAPDRVSDSLDKRLAPKLQEFMQGRSAQAVLRQRFPLSVWRWVEAASPPSRAVTAAIEEVGPDVVLVSPTIWPKNPVEADYIHAARALGIPTIGYVNSWDNLTSKGTVHVFPDVFIVWNEALAKEAVELHDIPREIIRITGAPHLDRFFEMRPTASRAEIGALMGCDDDTPYIVYLCSSRTLMASEAKVVTEIADALAREFPDGPPTLVVRPHPTNSEPWEGYAHPGVAIYPKQGDQADCPEAWQDYYNQLSNASCVIGLNTTAFLESIVADRPCLTIVADEFHGAQGKTGHFRHLLAGDFLEVSRDANEVVARVARILDGADEKAAGRRSFTKSFLRPCGIETPPTSIIADLIESMSYQEASYSARPAQVRPPLPGLSLVGSN